MSIYLSSQHAAYRHHKSLNSASSPNRIIKQLQLTSGAATNPSLPPDSPFYNPNNLHHSVFHAFTSPHPAFLPLRILEKIKARKQTSIAVIGGGLSSAQVVYLATTLGVTKVYHLRRNVRSKVMGSPFRKRFVSRILER